MTLTIRSVWIFYSTKMFCVISLCFIAIWKAPYDINACQSASCVDWKKQSIQVWRLDKHYLAKCHFNGSCCYRNYCYEIKIFSFVAQQYFSRLKCVCLLNSDEKVHHWRKHTIQVWKSNQHCVVMAFLLEVFGNKYWTVSYSYSEYLLRQSVFFCFELTFYLQYTLSFYPY